MRGRHRSSYLGLLLLVSQLYQLGLENIPPITLAMLGLNAYLFLFPAAPLMKACVSVHQAYWSGEWRRLLLSPFHHADDMHLYFNMVSFVMKGIRLERRLGSVWFAYVLAVFSLLTGALYLALEAGLTQLTEDQSYSSACAVGFSGVIFALKVLSNHYHPGGVTYVMGFPVSNRYASWVELVLIHITAPGTSLIGHLAGILVGLLYTTGPLKKMMKMGAGELENFFLRYFDIPVKVPVGFGNSSKCNHDFDFSFSRSLEMLYAKEERLMCRTARYGAARFAAPPPYGFRLTDEELRARRLMRLDGFM
uniref:Rhomboid domain containing 1 n=1 Tax=Hippocampus comes TaxID=109280 RepID=A0A3Q2Z9Y2_HIPCM